MNRGPLISAHRNGSPNLSEIFREIDKQRKFYLNHRPIEFEWKEAWSIVICARKCPVTRVLQRLQSQMMML